MTATEQAMTDLRNAVRADLIAELKTWIAATAGDHNDPDEALDDAVLTLEMA
jgi:hypothetical protein